MGLMSWISKFLYKQETKTNALRKRTYDEVGEATVLLNKKIDSLQLLMHNTLEELKKDDKAVSKTRPRKKAEHKNV